MRTQQAIEINRRLGGSLLNKSSLDFAEDAEQNTRSTYKKSAVWVRAIIIDHPFTDCNKRTASVVISSFIVIKNFEAVADILVQIASENITDLDKIAEMIKNANRKND